MAGALEPTTTVRAGEVVRLPPGSRDILPAEARELRAINAALLEVFESAGYGEVITPTLEYSDVIARGDIGEVSPSYRFADDRGAWLSLRSDMTVPLARVAATRFPPKDSPLRFWYAQAAYRPVPALQGRSREVQQAGVELFGVDGAAGEHEVLSLVVRALEATQLADARIVVGDARLSGTILAAAGVDQDTIAAAHKALASGQLVALEALLAEAGLSQDAVRATAALLRTRGGVDVLERHADDLGTPGAELAATLATLSGTERDRVIVDVGHIRDLDYYSGLVFDVVDPAVGEPIGGGGRYDTLVERFGPARPAVGFALQIDGVHRAQTSGSTR